MGRVGSADAAAEVQRDEHRAAEGAARTSDRGFRQFLRIEREGHQQVDLCKGCWTIWAQGWRDQGYETRAGGGMCLTCGNLCFAYAVSGG